MTQNNENDSNSEIQANSEDLNPTIPGAAPGKVLTDAAKRALEEAAIRREAEMAETAKKKLVEEWNGPAGEEPTRYGDWERKGITYDF
ncbi:DUF1674 domain-containing protein [Hirschia baltica]|uniref:DUF1674 domain-containing protein n=1 Tax=Hirschia baltica (strain ATCC 49814 / DSM 5838 / IFAM 1418) TaxID=582402 RepID=C6XRR4_HIRBI|nr:DUF1674 domain-containing protein [Hirschia baltica]ACT60674.1 protein of unknown function DUF1674 [Hirschia baltica ATCC 49814]